MIFKQWEGFKLGKWCDEVNTRDFIQLNYTPYEGDDSFLKNESKATKYLWEQVTELNKKEKAHGGVLDMDQRVSFIDAYGAGYISDIKHRKDEKIVGVQTDAPFKRAYMPIGGIRMADQAAITHGFTPDPKIQEIYTKYRKTHNQAVFEVYTPEMRAARHAHIITGLPDAYARGRIIGDYRRVALYGIDYLIKEKQRELDKRDVVMSEKTILQREEIAEQIKALKAMIRMAKEYGDDISQPAKNAREAIQWLYYGYLAAVKDQNGAAMSVGRNTTFLDIYIKRDLDNGVITEEEAQELIDQYVMKLRIVKFMRTPDYDDIFSGDPIWATETIGGMGLDGRTLVTKTAFRMIHTLHNMGPSPEPNLTILWSINLPINFKRFCAKYSIAYSSMQYENDDLMRITHGDDYGIACCVSPMQIGKQMQFFGARANLAKALLYAINGGIDEVEASKDPDHADRYQIGPRTEQVSFDENVPLDFKVIRANFSKILQWLAKLYVNTLNVIHYMHDHYYYEAAEMALYDTDVHRFFATGIAGLSVVADSLSAIKYAKVYPKWYKLPNGKYIAIDFKVVGDFPKYGNDDDRVDKFAVNVVKEFIT
ncbi:MAG: formate acetyltransferase, partial [Malacoplasma sp.]|nr:formate acetyltransferase [Malacoplasma sp.]